MTRVWTETDPEPADRPPVVCDDGVIARYDEEDWWTRMEIVHHPVPKDAEPGQVGAVTGGETCMDWETLVGTYGDLTEATADEALEVRVVFT